MASNTSVIQPLALLDLPTNQLMAAFGSGQHVPGSGSAAALMGLLAGQLTLTVCKISDAPEGTRRVELKFLADQLESRFNPRLREMFELDASGFDEVIDARRARDAATTPAERRRHRERALRGLERATDLVMDIADICVTITGHAKTAFVHGAKKVRGDSGAAISAALAGASTAIFIANLNLRSFQKGAWARQMQLRVAATQAVVIENQHDAFTLAASLQTVLEPPEQMALFDDYG